MDTHCLKQLAWKFHAHPSLWLKLAIVTYRVWCPIKALKKIFWSWGAYTSYLELFHLYSSLDVANYTHGQQDILSGKALNSLSKVFILYIFSTCIYIHNTTKHTAVLRIHTQGNYFLAWTPIFGYTIVHWVTTILYYIHKHNPILPLWAALLPY